MSKTPAKLRYYGQGWRLPGSTVTHIPGSWVYSGRTYGLSVCNRVNLNDHEEIGPWDRFWVDTNQLLCQHCVREVQRQIDFLRGLLRMYPDRSI